MRLGVRHAREGLGQGAFDLLYNARVDTLVEELKSGALLEGSRLTSRIKSLAKAMTSSRPAKAISGSIIQNSAACRAAHAFRTKAGTERVDIRVGLREAFDLQLSAHGEKDGMSEVRTCFSPACTANISPLLAVRARQNGGNSEKVSALKEQ